MIETDFDKFYESSLQQLTRYASKYISNSAAANDIAMEAINNYWSRRENFENEAAVRSFLRVCVKNHCLNYINHIESRIQTHEDMSALDDKDNCSASADAYSNELGVAVNRILSSLPEKTARVFTMSKYEKFTHKEIAAIENITVKCVEYHIKKAKTALREGLKDYLY